MELNLSLPNAEYYKPDDPRLPELIETVSKHKLIAIDTETTGLLVMTDVPLFWSIAFGEKDHIRRVAMPISTIHRFVHLLHDQTVTWVMANAKFDAHMLANVGALPLGNWIDIQVMHALLFEEQEHGLKQMHRSIFGWVWRDLFDVFGKPNPKKGIHMRDLLERVERENLQDLAEYASNDAFGTLSLYYWLDEKLHEERTTALLNLGEDTRLSNLFYDVEMPYTKVLWKCERNGVYTNPDYLQNLKGPMQDAISRLQRESQEMFARACDKQGIRREKLFNIGSNDDISEFLFDICRTKAVKKTSGGKSGIKKPSVDKESLEKMRDSADDKLVYDMLGAVLEYRKLTKTLGTYVENLIDMRDSQGRIHSRFNQDVARTGRLSSSAPNLQ